MTDQKQKNGLMRGLNDLWRNCFLSLKITIYALVIVFLVVGVVFVFIGAVLPGILLALVNLLIFLFLRRMDGNADKKFDHEFNEMVRRNKGE